jgi:hypothetical protein
LETAPIERVFRQSESYRIIGGMADLEKSSKASGFAP